MKNEKERKEVYKIEIKVFDDGISQHTFPSGIPFEHVRELFFKHMMLVQEQITMYKIKQEMNKVKLVKPDNLPINLKLHS